MGFCRTLRIRRQRPAGNDQPLVGARAPRVAQPRQAGLDTLAALLAGRLR